jgi:predicted dehydrogenase
MTAPLRELRVAVAGLGTIAQTIHLPLLERLDGRFRLAAVADVSPTLLRRVGERYGLPETARFADVDTMLAAGGFDAVLLLTPGSHVPAATTALRAGHAVLSEKPLGHTRDELSALAAEPAADRLMVGYMKQYDPAAQRLRRLLDTLGGPAAVHHVDVTVLHPSTPSQLAFGDVRPAEDVPDAALAASAAERERLTRTALGDKAPDEVRTLYDITLGSICHELSLIRLFADPPAGVDHAALWPAPAGAEPGSAPSVELSGPLARVGRYAIRWLYLPGYPAYRETVTVHHATGSLELVFPSPYLLNVPTVLTERTSTGDDPHGGGNGDERTSVYRSMMGGFEAELLAFHDLVTHGTPPLSGIADGVADVVTAQQAARRLAERLGTPLEGEAAHA